MGSSLKTVADVASWRLCVGCGACAYHCPQDAIRLVDDPTQGIRPVIDEPLGCGSCGACLDVCPAFETDYSSHALRPRIQSGLFRLFGPVLEVWEGYACDDEIRFCASSGGALTALSLYCLERCGMHGVLHIGRSTTDPSRNRTRMSRTRAELLAQTGSRYSPASACDGLREIERAPKACVFVGQPAEVTALRKAQALHPKLASNLGLALSFFCAGSPATEGTVKLLEKMGVDAAKLQDVRYRGNGWPGEFAATLRGDNEPAASMSYSESWGFLQRFRPYGIHLWPDDTGESADISCGDPWYRKIEPGELGSSLIVVRTELGREILMGAHQAGYLTLSRAEPWKIAKSQENLVRKRRSIWGRRLAFRAFGLPITRLRGVPLFGPWLGLSLKDKLRSTIGTALRIVRRNYRRPLSIKGEPTPSTR
jgi:coenzyme F420 hydrogenase subunit beta